MRPIRKAILTCLFSSSLYAGCGYDGQWDLGAGYRNDNFDWSYQGRGGSPNVRAEVNWKDMNIFEVFTRYILTGWDSIYLRTQGSIGWIIQAEPEYSVYGADNRQDLQTRAISCKVGNELFNAKGGIGFHIFPYKGRFDIAPIVGYSFTGLNMRYRDPKLIQHTNDLHLGCQANLRNHYRARFSGGFVGVDNIWRILNCLTLNIEAELHYAAYRARGNWTWEEPAWRAGELIDLRRRPQAWLERWHDCASAWGGLIQGSLVYKTANNWNLGVLAGYQTWKTREGEYCVDFIHDDIALTRRRAFSLPRDTNSCLNPIHWRSYWCWFTLQCQF